MLSALVHAPWRLLLDIVAEYCESVEPLSAVFLRRLLNYIDILTDNQLVTDCFKDFASVEIYVLRACQGNVDAQKGISSQPEVAAQMVVLHPCIMHEG